MGDDAWHHPRERKHDMIIDLLDGFEALTHRGLHVVRARYVESAEDAIAFAARRDATDDRAVPIGLRAIVPGVAPPSRFVLHGPLTDHRAIRACFAERAASAELSGGNVVAQVWIEGGTDVAIEGKRDPALGRVIELRAGVHASERMVPLAAAGAESLVREYREHHHQPHGERTRRMLEHVLLVASQFFIECDVEGFVLDPVRLHENGYTVLDAAIRAAGPLHVAKRLARDAHDRKGHYRPTGRQ